MNKLSAFKTYDIRGHYPKEVNEEIAFKVGVALIKFLKRKLKKKSLRIVIGRDCRLSSNSLFKSLSQGIVSQKGRIVDIGLVSTDTLYFALAYFKYDGGVMITASHNPKNDNGFKMLAKGLKCISQDWGMAEIKKLVEKIEVCFVKTQGKIIKKNFIPDYVKYILNLIDLKDIRPLKIVVDAGNGMGGEVVTKLVEKLPIKLFPLDFKTDGNFPNRSPNPKIKNNIKACQKKVIKHKADFGLAFDGDGDRAIFVDEKGKIIDSDIIIALFSIYFLQKEPRSKIVYNLTCSKVLKEIIEENNGIAIRTKTGHTFIKKAMQKHKAIFGGELSGHLYFRDVFYAESGGLVFVLMAKILSQINQPLSKLVKKLKKYSQVEINVKTTQAQKSIKKLAKFYQKGKQDYLDGLTVEFSNYWFNVRASNTEPLLRITVEGKDKKLVSNKLKQIKKIIKSI